MARVIIAIGLLAAALVCGYLFLAGFEYPGVTTWKLSTGTLGVLFFLASLIVVRRKPPR